MFSRPSNAAAGQKGSPLLLEKIRDQFAAIHEIQGDYHPVYGLGTEYAGSPREGNIRFDYEQVAAHFGHVLRKLHVRILDVGCNLGYATFALSEQTFNVVGIDINAQNIEFCKNVGAYTGSAAKFQQANFLEIAEAGNLDWENIDCVLLLNVVHQFIFERGIEYVRTFIGRLARRVDVLFIELALKQDYVRYGKDHLLPEDPGAILSECQDCDIELIKGEGRPLYKVSRKEIRLGPISLRVDKVWYSDNALDYVNRKYHVGESKFLKVFRFADGQGQEVFDREVHGLLKMKGALVGPNLLDWILTRTCGAVVMDEIHGATLMDAYQRFAEPDRLRYFLVQYLQIAAKLDNAGLFHNDLSAHNIVVSANDKIYAIDFEQADRECFVDPFAVMLWTMHDILAGQPVSYNLVIYKQLYDEHGIERADKAYYPNFSGMTLAAPMRSFITRAENHSSWSDFVASEIQSGMLSEATPDSVSEAAKAATVSEYDIELAYEFILRRRPESVSVVAEQLSKNPTRKELRLALMASAEYRSLVGLEVATATRKTLEWPKMDIEVDVPPETLVAMIRHIEENWALLGEREPHWSVLVHERFKAAAIGENIEEFYASGQQTVSCFSHAAERAGVDYRNLHRCFELGCGVGRISVWLARVFPELLAVDISAPHLRLAAEAVERAGLTNVELCLVDTIERIEALPSFDCFVSIIVLQHNPPPVIAFLLRTILKKLNPGGLAYFQVPTYRKDAVFSADSYLQGATVTGEMEVHVLPQSVVWKLAEQANCQVLDVREDNSTGFPNGVSNSILLMKRS